MGKALDGVKEDLQAYADRGVFRGFAEQPPRRGKSEFHFLFFGQRNLVLLVSEKERTLVMKDLLPGVPPDMHSRLKGFLEELFDRGLPDHRRIDRNSADVRFVRRGGNVSLVFKVKNNRYRYGVNKLINLVSWIHTYLQSWFPGYIWETLGEPQE